MQNFDKRNYAERISMLTERAKKREMYIYDLDIGESCYLLSLVNAIELFRMKVIDSGEIFNKQKELESGLLSYYQHQEIYDLHISIRNRYSEVLTEAEKSGCPVCRKLVRIFDGRKIGQSQEGANGIDRPGKN